MWITKIWLKGLDNKKIKSLQEKCEDILKKDPTFKFKILQYDEKSKKYTGFDKTKKGGDCYLMVFRFSVLRRTKATVEGSG
ncbi:MAG: hypothetical protein B6U95_09090 [Thermofilum sp. ex4484_82]|nr:MAG: hypothetical protein B6U95_09090 [Thermofilum sp. ex4484_82]OYT36003.1 MAG: hypothetical protein B6U96_09095 [Archaeoglobales archaeon ex4484_92]